MRALILGLSLPSVEFDNYSFLSAPSFGEYHQIVVDIASVSQAVDDVVNGGGIQQTFGGQAIVNGEASAHAFSLSALLDMRHRETEWLLSHGGLVVLFAYPEVSHAVAGAPWRCYDWLPAPEGISYASDLLPGFGRPGAVLVDGEHPFAPYIQQLAPHVAYRVYLNESSAGGGGANVFARSSGGQAIGFELTLAKGRLVVLPPLVAPQSDRAQTADALGECLARWQARSAGRPAKEEVS